MIPSEALNTERDDFKTLVRLGEDIRLGAYRTLVSNKSYFRPDEALAEGQLVWRKRLNFARNMNSKLQARVVEAFRVLNRLGTGLYRCQNVITDEIVIIPIDQLILCNLTLEQVKTIIEKLQD